MGADMWWRLEFYNERRNILALYGLEASSPGAAVLAGRKAVLAEYPAAPARRRRPSLWERAQRLANPDGGGWTLYRIGTEDGPGSTSAAATHAA
jgi:hypothetical protein